MQEAQQNSMEIFFAAEQVFNDDIVLNQGTSTNLTAGGVNATFNGNVDAESSDIVLDFTTTALTDQSGATSPNSRSMPIPAVRSDSVARLRHLAVKHITVLFNWMATQPLMEDCTESGTRCGW